MKIGELARAARCTVETVRYYEREGLLPRAQRTPSNYRSYGEPHLDRLRFIRNCRSLDMSHDEIRALLTLRQQPEASCAGVSRILEAHITHVVDRISELSRLRDELQELRDRCQDERDIDSCGIIQSLEAATAEPPSGKPGHLC